MGSYLIGLQTSIPSIKTRKTFPGCVRSFTGYPFEGSGDLSSLQYLSCVAYKLRNDTHPWSALMRMKETAIAEKIKAFIENEFNDRIIIIDEIQNIKTDKNKELTKSIQPLLQNIIKYGKNIKLILMSATPMYDRPDEIIFYINLLLENDGREKINKSDIFNLKDGTLKENADELLRKIFTGYVSFMRAEKPYDFPFRIYPTNSIVPKIEYYIDGRRIDKSSFNRYSFIDNSISNFPISNILTKNIFHIFSQRSLKIFMDKNVKMFL
jgi:hypothetical protein